MPVASSHAAQVLVADADRRLNRRLCEYVQASGWRPLAAYDGASALAILLAEPVHLGLVELDLPDVGGISVVLAARAQGRRFHVAFLGSREAPGARESCLALGGLGYMKKPLSPESLAPILQDALERPLTDAPGYASANPQRRLLRGQQVQLFIRGGLSAGAWQGKVEELSPGSVVVSVSRRKGAPGYVSLGSQVTVGFPTEAGWAEFRATVSGSYVSGSRLEITLSRRSQLVHRERRDAPRLPAALRVSAWPAATRDPAGEMVVGQTEDLSQRGLRVCFPQPLPTKGAVRIAVAPTGELGELRAVARPRWHQQVGEAGEEWHRYGLRFERLMPGAREQLAALLAQVEGRGRGGGKGAQPSDPGRAGPR